MPSQKGAELLAKFVGQNPPTVEQFEKCYTMQMGGTAERPALVFKLRKPSESEPQQSWLLFPEHCPEVFRLFVVQLLWQYLEKARAYYRANPEKRASIEAACERGELFVNQCSTAFGPGVFCLPAEFSPAAKDPMVDSTEFALQAEQPAPPPA